MSDVVLSLLVLCHILLWLRVSAVTDRMRRLEQPRPVIDRKIPRQEGFR